MPPPPMNNGRGQRTPREVGSAVMGIVYHNGLIACKDAKPSQNRFLYMVIFPCDFTVTLLCRKWVSMRYRYYHLRHQKTALLSHFWRHSAVFYLVRCKGFEPLTFWFVAKHSIQLS